MEKQILITGGAGFIGIHLAAHFASQGKKVLIYDNLSRKGVKRNLTSLMTRYPTWIHAEVSDILNNKLIEKALLQSSAVYHLASLAGTKRSLSNPMLDFEINLRGTLNLLEIMRKHKLDSPFIFACANGMVSAPSRTSKDAAAHYVQSYSQNFGIRGVVLRACSLYGPYQQGNLENEWITDFIRRILTEEKMTIGVDPQEHREVLAIDDFIDALTLSAAHASSLAGQIFSVGGGDRNCVTISQLTSILQSLHGREISPFHQPSPKTLLRTQEMIDSSRFESTTGWHPKVPIEKGVTHLYLWMKDHQTYSQ